MKLIIKCHPRYFAWKLGSEYGTLPLQQNLLKNYESIKKIFVDLKGYGVDAVYFENPHIELRGSTINIIKDIQHIQRLIGALQALVWDVYHIHANSLIPVTGLSMDEKIRVFDDIFKPPTTFYTALEKMCLVECNLLEKSI